MNNQMCSEINEVNQLLKKSMRKDIEQIYVEIIKESQEITRNDIETLIPRIEKTALTKFLMLFERKIQKSYIDRLAQPELCSSEYEAQNIWGNIRFDVKFPEIQTAKYTTEKFASQSDNKSGYSTPKNETNIIGNVIVCAVGAVFSLVIPLITLKWVGTAVCVGSAAHGAYKLQANAKRDKKRTQSLNIDREALVKSINEQMNNMIISLEKWLDNVAIIVNNEFERRENNE